MVKAPINEKGHFVPTNCGLCGCGNLRHEDGKTWRCDGLLDPEHPDKELEACWGYHIDGEPRISAVVGGIDGKLRGARNEGGA